MFHKETISQKRMVLPENQFNCQQIQGVKYTKIHRIDFFKRNSSQQGKPLALTVKLQACNFIKKRPQPRCFPLNIAKFLRAAILKNIC